MQVQSWRKGRGKIGFLPQRRCTTAWGVVPARGSVLGSAGGGRVGVALAEGGGCRGDGVPGAPSQSRSLEPLKCELAVTPRLSRVRSVRGRSSEQSGVPLATFSGSVHLTILGVWFFFGCRHDPHKVLFRAKHTCVQKYVRKNANTRRFVCQLVTLVQLCCDKHSRVVPEPSVIVLRL